MRCFASVQCQLLCSRCVLLTRGEMVVAIEDSRRSTEKHRFKNLLNLEELKEQMRSVRDKKVLVILLADLLDLPGSLLNSIRPLIGMNPIVLVGTKADPPAQTHPSARGKGVAERLRGFQETQRRGRLCHRSQHNV